ncbi:MAG: PIN domain protein [Treponema sp.]|nr:PIN domain protein [Treponema sp.]
MGNKTIYLDNCTFNRPFDDQTFLRISLETQAKLYIQSLIKNKKIDLIYSYVNFYENFNNPFDNKKLSITEFSKNAKDFITENNNILLKANEIILCKIKPLDALHLSCAINAKVDYFITVDDGILRYNTDEIQIFDPIDFIKYWEAHGGQND